MQVAYSATVDILLSSFSSDDEDEDEAAEVSPADPEVDDADDAPNDAQIPVKAEEGKEDKRKGKARARTPSHVLHTYSVAELSQFNKKNLQANVALLEGQCSTRNPRLLSSADWHNCHSQSS